MLITASGSTQSRPGFPTRPRPAMRSMSMDDSVNTHSKVTDGATCASSSVPAKDRCEVSQLIAIRSMYMPY